MIGVAKRKPLFSIVPQLSLLVCSNLGENLSALCCSSMMRSVESFELDDNCFLTGRFLYGQLGFDQVIRLTHLRISFWNFNECLYLLKQLSSQLHSFSVTIGYICEEQPDLISKIRSVSKI